MNKLRLVVLLCLITARVIAQGVEDKQHILIGSVDSITSTILGEQRRIWVYVPDQLSNNSSQRYPVVYLLDGEGHFSSVVGMLQQLSTGGNNNCPKMIVVAILNTNRTRDLTPTHVDADPPYLDSLSAKPSGGGENFIAFIEKELMPHVEARYPAAPYRMLIGHSLGGLMVMQTFVHHNSLFNGYISIDPSMWWDNKKLLVQAKKAIAERKFSGLSLYLGIANTLDDGMTVEKARKDTSVDTRHIRAIWELQSAFEKNRQNGLRYKGKFYPEDSHGSVPLITEYDAFRFFFDYFPMKFNAGDYLDSASDLAGKYRKHFSMLSGRMGYTIRPDEAEINFIGYEMLKQKQFKKAAGLFRLNIDNYPESFNVYDSYADYCIAIGDRANAIVYLKKALSIRENAGSRKKLTDLEAEQ